MSKTFFSKLNYTLANEDTSLEAKIAAMVKPKNTLAVCGSGGRTLPLVANTLDSLHCLDLAQEQLWLAELKETAIKEFGYQEYLLFWGFPPFKSSENVKVRQQMFEALILREPVRHYFSQVFSENNGRGLIYAGKWEQTFAGVPRALRKVVGTHYDEIFTFDDLETQKKYFDTHLEDNIWKIVPTLVLKLFGNAAFFNAFLYKGHFAKKNVPESYFEYYRHAYKKLFYQDLTKRNFFLQLSFLGKLEHAEGNTLEAQPHIYEAMKARLHNVKVHYHLASVLDFALCSPARFFDLVSLSDVVSYFNGQDEIAYLQKLAPTLSRGALVVVRCYLHVPQGTDYTGFTDVTPMYQAFIDAEKTQMYRIFVYRYE